MRLMISIIFASACVLNAAHAQSGAVYVFEEQSTDGKGFLQQPATQAGLVVKNACTSGSVVRGRTYLVKSSRIYWGLNTECVRVIINHRAIDASAIPSYLGVQVIGFYDKPQTNSITLRRTGTFARDGKDLPQYADKTFSSDVLGQDAWDELHSTGTLQSADEVTGRWHGTPKDGISNSWDDRYWFRTGRAYDAQLSMKYKALDNRLIRFTPYPADGSPQDGPVGFNINRRGAHAVVVRLFSPSNADYGQSFALVYESDPAKVATLVNGQIALAGYGIWHWFQPN
jgi:hypothetical protein